MANRPGEEVVGRDGMTYAAILMTLYIGTKLRGRK